MKTKGIFYIFLGRAKGIEYLAVTFAKSKPYFNDSFSLIGKGKGLDAVWFFPLGKSVILPDLITLIRIVPGAVFTHQTPPLGMGDVISQRPIGGG